MEWTQFSTVVRVFKPNSAKDEAITTITSKCVSLSTASRDHTCEGGPVDLMLTRLNVNLVRMLVNESDMIDSQTSFVAFHNGDGGCVVLNGESTEISKFCCLQHTLFMSAHQALQRCEQFGVGGNKHASLILSTCLACRYYWDA